MHSGLSNTELVTKLNQGDEATFAYLYNRYHSAVFANICKLIKTHEEAKDILQEVFILLWNNRKKLISSQELGGWLFTTSYYKSLEHLRNLIRKGVVEWKESLEDQLPEDHQEDIEINYSQKIAILHSAIEQLSPQKKAAFNLCRIQGMSYEAAATELGVSVETIKGYLNDAVKFIKSYVLTKEGMTASLGLYYLLLFIQ